MSVSTKEEVATLHVFQNQIHMLIICPSVYVIKPSSDTCFSHPLMTMSDKKLYAFIYCTVELKNISPYLHYKTLLLVIQMCHLQGTSELFYRRNSQKV